MSSFKSLVSITVLLFVQLSLCLLGSSASLSSSLWGEKVHFSARPCVWQLKSDVAVPSLTELSVCILLRLQFATEWTGFVYKGPGQRHIELGLQGSHAHLKVWLFGENQHLRSELKLNEWYSVCLTWSGRVRRLRVYINGTREHEAFVNPVRPRRLAQNGSLTLGVSHDVNPHGEVTAESRSNLLGEVGLFRMWAREWSAEEMSSRSCADGDVVSWDRRQWKYSCSTVPDDSLHCAWPFYKIQMRTFIHDTARSEKCSVSLEEVTRKWLESIFPRGVTVHDVFVSSPSPACSEVNNSPARHVQLPQGSKTISNACDKCFSCEVYVKVDPAANVGAVQANVTALLSLTFSYDLLNLTSDPDSISIRPVELLPPRPARHTNMLTTREPLDLDDVTVGPDNFFRVNMSVIVTGSPHKPQDIIETWVTKQLEVNGTMIVLNFIVQENRRSYSVAIESSVYHCAFHVQEYNRNSVAETQTLIAAALTSKYENGSIAIQSVDVTVKHIVPENCLEDTTLTIYGNYIWPEAFPQVNEEMGCIAPKSERAYRLCKLDIETDKTSWAHPDMTNCNPLKTISDLDNVTVTAGNAAEVVDMIQDLVDVQLDASEELSASDLDMVVEKLSEVVNISTIKPAIGDSIVNIVATILLSKTDVVPVADTVLYLTDTMGNNMDFEDESVSITAPLLALSMVNVLPGEFSGLTFGVSSISSNRKPETFLNQGFESEPLPDADATISLPSALEDFFSPGQRNKTRVQFHFYGTQKLFQDPLITNGTQSSLILNSFIVSASINNSHVSNLKERVLVTLKHQVSNHDNKVKCVFWDFQINGGQGGWNGTGCETRTISSSRTSCLCDHLTHFAVLLDVSRAPVSDADGQMLTVISYVGCGISSIFLGITLLTYLAFEKLRRDYPSKILINLSAALLGLSMLFLLDSWLSSFSNYGLCIATAASLHYFLLASFMWMGLEAVHMYLALVKVFNLYVPSYMLKLCAVGWGTPLVIVSLVLAINKDAYGSIIPEEAAVEFQSPVQFCWVQHKTFFYVTVVAVVLLILLFNISIFVVVLIQLRRMRANKLSAGGRSSLQDWRAVVGLTVLLGLTWAMGFFSFGPGRVALMYLFTIFNSLHGLFVFLFHCLMKETVRNHWRIHLCWGCFRHSDYSDASRTVTVGGPCKKDNLVNSVSNTTIRKVSDSSSESARNHNRTA